MKMLVLVLCHEGFVKPVVVPDDKVCVRIRMYIQQLPALLEVLII